MENNFLYIRTAKTLPVSVTGSSCSLNCRHCDKHYLGAMTEITSLLDEQGKIKKKISGSFNSFLISGGYTESLEVPVYNYPDILEMLIAERKFLNFHTGFLKKENFPILKYADSVSLDLVIDKSAIRNIYGLDPEIISYFGYMNNISEYRKKNRFKFEIVPHITIGLNKGQYSGEYEIIEQLSSVDGIRQIVFNILRPTPSIGFNYYPEIEFVKKILTYAGKKLKNRLLILGCMRPSGKYRKQMDIWGLENGLSGIVNPSFPFQTEYERFDNCCALYFPIKKL